MFSPPHSSSSAAAAAAAAAAGDEEEDDDEMKEELDSPNNSDPEIRRRRMRRVFRVPGEWGAPIPQELLLREIGVKRKHCQQQRQVTSSLPTTADYKLTNKELTKTRFSLPPGARTTFHLAFSADGRLVASCHGDHNVYVCEVKSGKVVQTLTGHPRTPWCVVFHPSQNDVLASGCLAGHVRVWDLNGGSELLVTDSGTVIASLAFHPRVRLLAIGTFNEVIFWDWNKPLPLARASTENTKEKVRLVRFDRLGSSLITGITNFPAAPQQQQQQARSRSSNSRSSSSSGLFRPNILRASSFRPRVVLNRIDDDNSSPPEELGGPGSSLMQRLSASARTILRRQAAGSTNIPIPAPTPNYSSTSSSTDDDSDEESFLPGIIRQQRRLRRRHHSQHQTPPSRPSARSLFHAQLIQETRALERFSASLTPRRSTSSAGASSAPAATPPGSSEVAEVLTEQQERFQESYRQLVSHYEDLVDHYHTFLRNRIPDVQPGAGAADDSSSSSSSFDELQPAASNSTSSSSSSRLMRAEAPTSAHEAAAAAHHDHHHHHMVVVPTLQVVQQQQQINEPSTSSAAAAAQASTSTSSTSTNDESAAAAAAAAAAAGGLGSIEALAQNILEMQNLCSLARREAPLTSVETQHVVELQQIRQHLEVLQDQTRRLQSSIRATLTSLASGSLAALRNQIDDNQEEEEEEEIDPAPADAAAPISPPRPSSTSVFRLNANVSSTTSSSSSSSSSSPTTATAASAAASTTPLAVAIIEGPQSPSSSSSSVSRMRVPPMVTMRFIDELDEINRPSTSSASNSSNTVDQQQQPQPSTSSISAISSYRSLPHNQYHPSPTVRYYEEHHARNCPLSSSASGGSGRPPPPRMLCLHELGHPPTLTPWPTIESTVSMSRRVQPVVVVINDNSASSSANQQQSQEQQQQQQVENQEPQMQVVTSPSHHDHLPFRTFFTENAVIPSDSAVRAYLTARSNPTNASSPLLIFPANSSPLQETQQHLPLQLPLSTFSRTFYLRLFAESYNDTTSPLIAPVYTPSLTPATSTPPLEIREGSNMGNVFIYPTGLLLRGGPFDHSVVGIQWPVTSLDEDDALQEFRQNNSEWRVRILPPQDSTSTSTSFSSRQNLVRIDYTADDVVLTTPRGFTLTIVQPGLLVLDAVTNFNDERVFPRPREPAGTVYVQFLAPFLDAVERFFGGARTTPPNYAAAAAAAARADAAAAANENQPSGSRSFTHSMYRINRLIGNNNNQPQPRNSAQQQLNSSSSASQQQRANISRALFGQSRRSAHQRRIVIDEAATSSREDRIRRINEISDNEAAAAASAANNSNRLAVNTRRVLSLAVSTATNEILAHHHHHHHHHNQDQGGGGDMQQRPVESRIERVLNERSTDMPQRRIDEIQRRISVLSNWQQHAGGGGGGGTSRRRIQMQQQQQQREDQQQQWVIFRSNHAQQQQQQQQQHYRRGPFVRSGAVSTGASAAAAAEGTSARTRSNLLNSNVMMMMRSGSGGGSGSDNMLPPPPPPLPPLPPTPPPVNTPREGGSGGMGGAASLDGLLAGGNSGGGGGGGAATRFYPGYIPEILITPRARPPTYYTMDAATTAFLSSRIQRWDFRDYQVPDITQRTVNVVVRECSLHSDACLDVSSDGQFVAVLQPSDSGAYSAVGLYSLKQDSLGQNLFTFHFDQNTVSVSIAPSSNYIVVGYAGRGPLYRFVQTQRSIGQILSISRCVSSSNPEDSSLVKLEPVRELFAESSSALMAINCMHFLPVPGYGIVYGTNTGELVLIN